MNKNLLLILFLFWVNVATSAVLQKDLSSELRTVMKNKKNDDEQKEKVILTLKNEATRLSLSPAEQFERNQKIYSAYKKYIIDSAVNYTLKNSALAASMGDVELQRKMSIQLASLYSTKGMYIESKALLDRIQPQQLSRELLPFYYESYSAYFSHYGQSNNTVNSFHKSELYRDSLLAVLPKETSNYQITNAIKQHFLGHNQDAETSLLALLEGKEWNDPEYATIAYFLGLIYKERGDLDLQTHYLSLSAISDIKNSTKDNASLQALALMYYDVGDIDKAYVFMEAAINDAIFCNVRYRTVENSSFYPIINAAFQEKEDFKKYTLRKYLALISILSLILGVGIVYIYRQMNRLAGVKKLLHQNNDMLVKLNRDLEHTNSKLFESNHIKEEYIAHFFYICSTYIEKIENYRKVLYKKASTNQYDALMEDLKSSQVVETELEELYKNFDVIFLNLYPTFVEDFNKLLTPNESVLPKPGDLLNTELRIFALIRLGITDSMKIATFLRYSLRTVYNYRTKVRNKAADSRDELEEKVKLIATIHAKDKK